MQKVVHLDLKPENIVLCNRDSNNVKIIDFGLAQRVEGSKEIKTLSGKCKSRYLKEFPDDTLGGFLLQVNNVDDNIDDYNPRLSAGWTEWSPVTPQSLPVQALVPVHRD